MKPSQEALPLQSPEQCNKERFVSNTHSPCPAGPIHSSGLYPPCIDSPLTLSTQNTVGSLNYFVKPPGLLPNSPANTGTKAQPSMWQAHSPPQHTVPSGSGLFSSPQMIPARQINNTSKDGLSPASVFHPSSSQFVKSLNHHSSSCNVKRDQEVESMVNPSSSGSNNETSQRKESNKIQQHELTPSSEITISAGDLNCPSLKRHREIDNCYENAKKLCPDGANSGKRKPAISIPGSSPGTSQVSQPSLKNFSAFELKIDAIRKNVLHVELACGQSTYSTLKPTRTHCTSQKPNEEGTKRKSEENQSKNESSKVELTQKVGSTSLPVDPVRPSSGHPLCSAQVLQVKVLNRVDQVRESRKTDCNTPKTSSKPNSSTLSCHALERNKGNRGRRPVIPDDIDQLFTPDPRTYVVSPTSKAVKPKIDGETGKSPISEKASSPASGNSPSVTGSACHKTPHSRDAESPNTRPASKHKSPVGLPPVTTERVKLGKVNVIKDKGVANSPISSESKPKDVEEKSENNSIPLDSSNLSSSSLNSDTTISAQTSSSQCTASQSLEEQAHERGKTEVNGEDPIDMDLDLGLSFQYSLDLNQSSDSSEDDELISFQEIMACVAKPPETPEKGALSDPSTPEQKSSQPSTVLPSTIKSGVYKSNLDQMLEEIKTNKRAKEVETQLLSVCQESRLQIAEDEKAEENQGEDIPTEQQEFLLRYAVMSNAIREVPPGEVVFNLERFGILFDENNLQLRRFRVPPQGTAQKTLLWSSPAQLRLHVIIGLFQDVYDSSPCPPQVTRFLFMMLSVHSERIVSEKILQALKDIACSAAYQIGEKGNHKFQVWVPSLADVTQVLMNLGAGFVTFFPFENLQPLFTEENLMDDVYIKSETPTSRKLTSFPEHNCRNMLKYLSFCMGLCPRAFSDDELLLLLTMIGKISLDTQRILQSTVEVTCLQYKILNNIRDWDAMLSRMCRALTDLTDDHHNMCLLVQLLPDNTRGNFYLFD
ncbi:SMC5-SMC6 complex localization factor protein 2 isoform X2 [Cololabis saira]|uniref:SMC5-SMC6 complex localization factor protein 2 isoform X2 n=1 Tax=Cololabis saira TaxID=129043 RepID=UPI002AD26CC1|nr:SMC5-SMC6 complex localization factor protein 2 isoform X2 [Cololabis saira]